MVDSMQGDNSAFSGKEKDPRNRREPGKPLLLTTVKHGEIRLVRKCSNITATNNGKETAEHTQLGSEVVQKVMSPTGSPTGVIEPQ